MAELRAQITQAGVRVDVDAPKGQDLARVMEEMRAKYEKIAQKNQEELKAWHESQVIHKSLANFFKILSIVYTKCVLCGPQLTEVQVQVTESTTALKEATSLLSDTKRRYQGLEIELQSALSLVNP